MLCHPPGFAAVWVCMLHRTVAQFEWCSPSVAGGAQHWSARGVFDRRATLWGSWAVKGRVLRFWFGGDSGYCPIFPVS